MTLDGKRVLLAGQKSGAMFGINPDTGEVLWKTQAGEGGMLGGIEWGFTVDGDARTCRSRARSKRSLERPVVSSR